LFGFTWLATRANELELPCDPNADAPAPAATTAPTPSAVVTATMA